MVGNVAAANRSGVRVKDISSSRVIPLIVCLDFWTYQKCRALWFEFGHLSSQSLHSVDPTTLRPP
jgi:hypothetical protein